MDSEPPNSFEVSIRVLEKELLGFRLTVGPSSKPRQWLIASSGIMITVMIGLWLLGPYISAIYKSFK